MFAEEAELDPHTKDNEESDLARVQSTVADPQKVSAKKKKAIKARTGDTGQSGVSSAAMQWKRSSIMHPDRSKSGAGKEASDLHGNGTLPRLLLQGSVKSAVNI